MAMDFRCSSDVESIELPDEAKAAFAESMFATMDASDGVGLAAPQVGCPRGSLLLIVEP